MAIAQSFVQDPIPFWDTLGADTSQEPHLGPASLGAGGCKLMVRCRGLNPTLTRSSRAQEGFLLAAGTAVGRSYIQTCDFPMQRDLTCMDLLLHFKVDAGSTARMQEVADTGSLDIIMDGTEHSCEAFLLPSEVRSDEVQIVVRGFRTGWGRVGVTRMLLRCAGYRDTDVQVLREAHGAFSPQLAALWPDIGKGSILIAVVRPPAGDRELRQLPRGIVCPFMSLNIAINVQGRQDGHARQGVAQPPPPNPFRQRQREQDRAARASRRGQAQPGRGSPRTPATHPVPGTPTEASAPPSAPRDHPSMAPPSAGPQREGSPAAPATTDAPPGFTRPGLSIGPSPRAQPARAFHPAQGLSSSHRMGRDRRGLGQADTPAAAQERATATLPAALPPQIPDNLLSSAGFMDWAPTASPVPSPSRPPTPLTDHPAPPLGLVSHLGGEPPPLAQTSQHLDPSSAGPYLPPQPMEGVETAIILPEEGAEGDLVDLARMAAHDMTDEITPRQVDAAIAHVIRQEPSTWREALVVGDSASCPHNLRVALRARLEDSCPDMRPCLSDEDFIPDPSQAYPAPPPAPPCPPERPATAPACPLPPGPAFTPRRSSRESRPPPAWWQSESDPAQEAQGGQP